MTLNPQPGDIVQVRAQRITVAEALDLENDGWFALNGNIYTPSEILAIEPRPLKVGDIVQNASRTGGEIIAIYEDRIAWVRWHEICIANEVLSSLSPFTEEQDE